MKKQILFAIFAATQLFFTVHLSAQMGINNDNSLPDNSAMLDVKSNSKGMLIPRMTQSQISAITTPANGLFVFCTTDNKFYAYVASANVWKEVLYGSGTIAPNTVPSVTTADFTNITQTTATSGGNVTSDGGVTVTARGVCWNTSSNPTTANNHTTDSSGTGVFVSNLTGLTANTLYYVRAYATNSLGTAYGNEVTFSTLANLPTVTTTTVTNITQTTATSGGNVTFEGSATVTACGVCWSTAASPTIADSHTNDGSGTGVFVSNLTGLTAITPYYVRAYATNSFGTSYGNQVTFSTLANLPTITTTAVTDITPTTATSGGNVTSDGGASMTARGVCWSLSSSPTTADSHTTDGSGTGVFVSNLTGLTGNTFYYVRAYSTNSVGTAYGNQMSFTTGFTIGESYGGGIIFYIDGTGLHGLISAISDQSTGVPWGCFDALIGGTGTAIGTGQANTTAIVNGCIESIIAARICDDLVLNGYSDWFLPSKDELNLLYQQKSVVGGFSTNYYWSSSEYDAFYAWFQNFLSGFQDGYGKEYPGSVRAVRAF